MDVNEIGRRLQTARAMRGLTMDELAKMVGVNKSTIKRYENGEILRPRLPAIQSIAIALNISPVWLIGKSDDMFEGMQAQIPTAKNVIPMPKMRQIPLVGDIACGTPILAQENIEGYIDIPDHVSADFALRCKGDSMKNARILDGDIVYIRKQPEVENGEIAAVLIGEEATLKRVYVSAEAIVLQPENPEYPPLTYIGDKMADVAIIGKAVAFTSTVR